MLSRAQGEQGIVPSAERCATVGGLSAVAARAENAHARRWT